MALTRLSFPDWCSTAALPWLNQAIDYGRHMKPLWFDGIVRTETTDRPYETYDSFTKFGLMVETDENSPLSYDLALQGFDLTLTPLQYSLGFKVSRILYDDDKLGVARNLASGLGESDTETRNILVANVINNGTSTSYPVSDAAALFSTAHYREDGVTFRNRLATAADFSVTSFRTALTDFATQFKSGRGFYQNYVPANIFCHHDAWWDVAEVLQSGLKPGTANNDANVQKSYPQTGSSFNLLPPVAYLTDTDSVYLAAAKEDHGFILLQKEAFNTATDVDFDTRCLKTGAWTRYTTGVVNNGLGLYAMIGA
jgi:hypothetical protein